MNAPRDKDHGARRIVDLVKKSAIYRDYARAFKETTGLALNIRA